MNAIFVTDPANKLYLTRRRNQTAGSWSRKDRKLVGTLRHRDVADGLS